MIKRTAFMLITAGLVAVFAGTTVEPLLGLQRCLAQPAPVQPAKPKITFQGGPGDSPETAVVISGAPNSRVGIETEYHFLEKKFGQQNVAWKLKRQSVLNQKGKVYDRMDLEMQDGSAKTVFFDISEFFGRL